MPVWRHNFCLVKFFYISVYFFREPGRSRSQVEFSTAEDFRNKVTTIKESYFGAKKEANSDSEVDNAVADNAGVDNTQDLSSAMAAYTTAISKTKDIKLSIK